MPRLRLSGNLLSRIGGFYLLSSVASTRSQSNSAKETNNPASSSGRRARHAHELLFDAGVRAQATPYA